MPSRTQARDGFTLIEMLVALAVFGLAAMALIKLATESARHAAQIEQQTLAALVAERVAAEVSLGRTVSRQGQTEVDGLPLVWMVVPVIRRQGVELSAVQVWSDDTLLAERLAHRIGTEA